MTSTGRPAPASGASREACPERAERVEGPERTTHEISEDASRDHDVHPVRHLGGVVSHHHDVSDADAALHRDPGRPGLLDRFPGIAGIAVLRRPDRRPVLRHRTGDGGSLHRLRRAPVSGHPGDDVLGRFLGDAGVLPGVLPDRRAHQFDHDAERQGPGPGLPADSRPRHARVHRRGQLRQPEQAGEHQQSVHGRAVAAVVMAIYSITSLPHTPPPALGQKVTWQRAVGLDTLSMMKQTNFMIFIIASILAYPAHLLLLVRERLSERSAGAECRVHHDARSVGGSGDAAGDAYALQIREPRGSVCAASRPCAATSSGRCRLAYGSADAGIWMFYLALTGMPRLLEVAALGARLCAKQSGFVASSSPHLRVPWIGPLRRGPRLLPDVAVVLADSAIVGGRHGAGGERQGEHTGAGTGRGVAGA